MAAVTESPTSSDMAAVTPIVMIVDEDVSFLINTAKRLKEVGISAIMVQNSSFAAKLLRITHPTTYHCGACSDIFDSAEEEKQHVRTCTLKRRFVELYKPRKTCQLCDEASNVSVDTLGRHMIKSHGTSCGECGKKLRTESGLKIHIANHQKEDKQNAENEKRELLQQKLTDLEAKLGKFKLSTKPGLILASETSGVDAIKILGEGKVPIVVLAENQRIGLESYAGAHDLFCLPLRDGDLAKIQGYIQQ